MKEIKMFKLPLQFFGEDGGGDDDNDFTEDFFDDGDDYYDTDEFDDDGDPDADADTDFDVDNDTDGDTDDVADDGADGGEEHDKATSSSTVSDGPPKSDVFEENSQLGSPSVSPLEKADDLISELRALGYVGNDLASLTADMKRRREASSKQEAREERAAVNAEGKRHVRSGVPGKSASGDGTGGINERQVERFVSITKASKETARQRLSKHARLIEGK